MSKGLEERFEYLKGEKEQNLALESRPAQDDVQGPEEEEKGRNPRAGRLFREVLWLIAALIVALGLGFLIQEFFSDPIAGQAFVPGNWKPADEVAVEVKIHEGFWREGGVLYLYTLVCLLGIYLGRLVVWSVTTVLPSAFEID